MSTRLTALTSFCVIILALTGCGKSSSSGQSPTDDANSQTPASEPSVKLSSSQLSSIKIGPAQNGPFSVEKEAIGSVSFVDDPAIIQAESTLLGAAAAYDLNHKELARVRSLGDSNGIAQKELEQAVSDEQTAAAALRAARDAVRVLGKSDAEVNQMINTGQIESSSSGRHAIKLVIANVVESDSPLLHPGQRAAINVTDFPNRTFDGAVTEVYSTVDPNSHRVTLRTEVTDPADELRPGMLADVMIQVQKPEDSVSVPENGVVREGDGTMTVWVTTDRIIFFQRVVKTGLRGGGNVQILQGLHQGEMVVKDGAVFLDNLLEAPPSD